MRQALKLHPDSHCPAVTGIEVEIARPTAGTLALRYQLTGDVAGLRIPAPASPVRADGLWRHSCFEAFVRAPDGEAYEEFNLAPSTEWAAYGFTGYRSGMSPAEIAAPRIEVRTDDRSLVLEATLDLSPLAGLPIDGPWRLGLSAVVEDAEGAISYWALAHPPGQADFHHPDCFAAELVAPGGP